MLPHTTLYLIYCSPHTHVSHCFKKLSFYCPIHYYFCTIFLQVFPVLGTAGFLPYQTFSSFKPSLHCSPNSQ